MSHIPSKDAILAWIAENPGKTSKRDLARAFGLKGDARVELKQRLRELQDEGRLEKRRRSWHDSASLPPVTPLEILAPTRDGDLFARPITWRGAGAAPSILYVGKKGAPGLSEGDRILARITPVADADHAYEARLIRRIGGGAQKLLGIFRVGSEGGRIAPIDKGAEREWQVPEGATGGARDGELVEAEQTGPRDRLGLPRARIVARLGDPTAPRAVSLIAIHQHGIRDSFPEDVLAEAVSAKPAELGTRKDLRALPLITIDPADARDRDDAVAAAPDDDPKNPGGHILWVAIADVAHYVRPGSPLDREARARGNSTYFPDRVVPMLPDRLSGDLCSLAEGQPRAAIVLRMVLDSKGRMRSHQFTRAMIRSHAALSYEEVQQAQDGAPNAHAQALVEPIIRPLYAAYEALKIARAKRQPLDLDLPERQIVLSDEGKVVSVAFRERLDAHRLIEEFMIHANVAAAETLKARKSPLLYRIHEEPTPEKVEALREVAAASGFTLAKGQVLHTRQFNRLLSQAEGTEFDQLINHATLRAMTQAYYASENLGHFGLALRAYAHFTSPIRRYADLIVHRALIAAHGWGKDGLSQADIEHLDETALAISEAERRSMAAERDTNDRYLAAYLSERVGAEFQGRISGIARFGLFVQLTETGADGLVPISSIGHEYYLFDAERQTLTGEQSGFTLGLGLRVTVRLVEAVPVTGGLLLELLEVAGKPLARAPIRKGKAPARRKLVQKRGRSAKLARKAARRRH